MLNLTFCLMGCNFP